MAVRKRSSDIRFSTDAQCAPLQKFYRIAQDFAGKVLSENRHWIRTQPRPPWAPERHSMRNPLTLICNFILILAAVACTLGALISAFSFTIDGTLLFIIWLAAALVLSVLHSLWRGYGLLAFLPLLIAAIVWQFPAISEGAKWAIFQISREYNKWLVVPVLFADARASEYELTLFFAAAGALLAMLLAAAICLRRSAFLTILITAPVVFITFVIIYNQPDPRFLMGLLAVYLTLLISGSLYSDDFRKREKAVLPSIAIALILLGITYLVAPPESYKREGRIDPIDFQIRSIASRIGVAKIKYGVGWPVPPNADWRFNTESVEVSNAGTRTITDRVILEVTASEPGTFYLRGYSMQHFNGNRWSVNSDTLFPLSETEARALPTSIAWNYMFLNPDDAPIEVKRVNMNIQRFRDESRIIAYTPYYGANFSKYYSERDDYFLYTEESILRIAGELPPGILYYGPVNEYATMSRAAYTQIDETTAEGLRRLASEAGIDTGAGRAAVVDQVADYIRSSARYTLSPYVIPDNEDFALFFLQSSRQGYCIHFATAATLMLRALDIPARITTGFVATVPPGSVGEAVEVTDRNAHAWVEVFYYEIGWLPLEVTPAAEGSGIPGGARPHTPANPPAPASDPAGNTSRPGQDPDDIQPGSPSPPPGATPGDGSGDETDAEAAARQRAKAILQAIAIALAACAVSLALRRPIARAIRKRRLAQDDTNAAVICAWRFVTRMTKQPPEEIEELALKARFSQHTITEDERAGMISYASDLLAGTYSKSGIFGKIWLYIRGL